MRAQRILRLPGSVGLLITSSAEMRILNRRFRSKDRTTDVLSFPAADPAGKEVAGDLAISAEIAADQAAERGHSLTEELKILILHGLLHLSGFDHENDSGEMAEREVELRNRLKLPTGLIERTAGQRAQEPGIHARKSKARPVTRTRRSGKVKA